MSHQPSYGRYSNGCRCEGCREAKSAYMRQKRDTRQMNRTPVKGPYGTTRWIAMDVPANRHGTIWAYQEKGCRCDPCRHRNDLNDKRTSAGRAKREAAS